MNEEKLKNLAVFSKALAEARSEIEKKHLRNAIASIYAVVDDNKPAIKSEKKEEAPERKLDGTPDVIDLTSDDETPPSRQRSATVIHQTTEQQDQQSQSRLSPTSGDAPPTRKHAATDVGQPAAKRARGDKSPSSPAASAQNSPARESNNDSGAEKTRESASGNEPSPAPPRRSRNHSPPTVALNFEQIFSGDKMQDLVFAPHTSRFEACLRDEFGVKDPRSVALFDVSPGFSVTDAPGSHRNHVNLTVVMHAVSSLAKHGIDASDICVLVPYLGQLYQFTITRTEIAEESMETAKLRLETFDAVQGREFPYVIVDTVRKDGLGFLGEANRLNVALSRARFSLIVVVNCSNLADCDNWRQSWLYKVVSNIERSGNQPRRRSSLSGKTPPPPPTDDVDGAVPSEEAVAEEAGNEPEPESSTADANFDDSAVPPPVADEVDPFGVDNARTLHWTSPEEEDIHTEAVGSRDDDYMYDEGQWN
ncbi:AAA domain-containing protein [Phyllosticta capitalensis]|uniref:AAA domain-containing protein n=1 Tax=Phyllosticta capitalensis TaxID=121624 RepID=A0ABR1YSI8_9PEZI